VKKVLQSGFDWLVDAYDTLTDGARSQSVILEIMRNYRADGSNKEMKRMYAKVDEILKIKLITKTNHMILRAKPSQDVEMKEEGKDSYSDACTTIMKTCQFLRMI
jgi:hypothetical protein